LKTLAVHSIGYILKFLSRNAENPCCARVFRQIVAS